MVLLIDNYDSFSYNLYQLLASFRDDIKVVRNDEITINNIKELNPEAIFLSPGPGKPKDAGICEDVVKELKGLYPILGVCLGHQAICEAFGGTVSYAKELMHGKVSFVKSENSKIFDGIEQPFKVARYHSLAAVESTLPDELRVTARTEDGEVMAVEHKDYNIVGLQFHPESVLTPDGHTMIKNFFETL
ncbi:anthranilate synthase component II [Howardella ureilytica]